MIDWAAISITRRPARGDPVSDTMSTRGCATSASPTSGPVPLTRLKTPFGSPASRASSAKMNELSGAISLPLSTTVHPAAIAAPAFMTIIKRGTFQGVMAPTTPAGSRCTIVWSNRSCHATFPTSSAKIRRFWAGEAVCSWAARLSGWPTSLTIVRVICSERSSIRSAIRLRIAARSSGVDCDHSSSAAAAALAARSTSAAVPRGTIAYGSSVEGLTTVIVPVPDDGCHAPFTKIALRSIRSGAPAA